MTERERYVAVLRRLCELAEFDVDDEALANLDRIADEYVTYREEVRAENARLRREMGL